MDILYTSGNFWIPNSAVLRSPKICHETTSKEQWIVGVSWCIHLECEHMWTSSGTRTCSIIFHCHGCLLNGNHLIQGLSNPNMGQWEISRILKWRYVRTIFLAIFCGNIQYSLKFRPEILVWYMVDMVGTSNLGSWNGHWSLVILTMYSPLITSNHH